MPIHEVFEELCALAVTGDVTVEEFRKLQEHLHECPSCRACYRDFHSIVGEGLPVLQVPRAARWTLGGRGLKKRFIERAGKEGISIVEPRRRPVWQWWMLVPAGAAAALLLAVWPAYRSAADRQREAESRVAVLSGKVAELERLVSGNRVPAPAVPQPAPPPAAPPDAGDRERDLAHRLSLLRAEHDVALADRGRLEERISALSAQLELTRGDSGISSAEAERLGRSLRESQLALAQANQNLESLRAAHSVESVTVAEQRMRLEQLAQQAREQTETIERERQLLAAGKDIRDLMGARNLRVMDVLDTGTSRSRSVPGRIFLTQGKSLIFYAFDLQNKGNLEKVSFQVWGKRDGRSQAPRSLGIFYVDDSAQKRWVMKFEDPNVLAQIDQVFVTAEPLGGSRQPTGKQLLTAGFLNETANHP
ncbi:MAG TPA: hypothetical protein VM120_13985 [Bryobacteraceae bacterium]|nr:hypothetical protein [Bryobacteraceae bacterium]